MLNYHQLIHLILILMVLIIQLDLTKKHGRIYLVYQVDKKL